MNDYIEIINENDVVVAAGNDREHVITAARATGSKQLIGEGTRPDGSTYGFFVSKAPACLGM